MSMIDAIECEGAPGGRDHPTFMQAAEILAEAIRTNRVAHNGHLDRQLAELGWVWGLRGRYWLWWAPTNAQRVLDRTLVPIEPF